MHTGVCAHSQEVGTARGRATRPEEEAACSSHTAGFRPPRPTDRPREAIGVEAAAVTCRHRESGHEEGASRDEAAWAPGVSPVSPAIPQDARPRAGAPHRVASAQAPATDLAAPLGRARGERGPRPRASTQHGRPRPPRGPVAQRHT